MSPRWQLVFTRVPYKGRWAGNSNGPWFSLLQTGTGSPPSESPHQGGYWTEELGCGDCSQESSQIQAGVEAGKRVVRTKQGWRQATDKRLVRCNLVSRQAREKSGTHKGGGRQESSQVQAGFMAGKRVVRYKQGSWQASN